MSWKPPESAFATETKWEPPENVFWSPPEEVFSDHPSKIEDTFQLKQRKAAGEKLTEKQERLLWEEEENRPLLNKAVGYIGQAVEGLKKAVPEISSGTVELVKKGIAKPLYALPAITAAPVFGSENQKVYGTPYTREEGKKIYEDMIRAWRSFGAGVARDTEEMANALVRGAMFGTGLTDAMMGIDKEERFRSYMTRENMRELERAAAEEQPDRMAALLSENPLLRGVVDVALKLQGVDEESRKAGVEEYTRLVQESGLTKEQLDEQIMAAGEFFSPVAIPGYNQITSRIAKKTIPVIEKKSGEVLSEVVAPIAGGVEATGRFVDRTGKAIQTGAAELGRKTVDDPDTLVKSAVNTLVMPIRPPAKGAERFGALVKDIARQAKMGIAGRKGILQRAGEDELSSQLTKRLFGAQGWGGVGRAKTADWMLRQGAAIMQPAVNGGALNVAMGLPDIETAEQGGYMFGYGMGIGGLAGSRIPDRAMALVDPTTTGAEKISRVLTPDFNQRRIDEDADIKRFLAKSSPEFQQKMSDFANVANRKKILDDAIAEQKSKLANTIGADETAWLNKYIANLEKQRAALEKSTPETEAELLRQVQLTFLDAFDQAQLSATASGLNDFNIVILDNANVDSFYRKLYGETLTNASNIRSNLIGKTNLSQQDAQALMQADEVINRFNRDVNLAQSSRGFAIQEDSTDPNNENYQPDYRRRLNQKGATVVINGDLVKSLNFRGFDLRRTVMHELYHGLSKFKEVQDMQRPLRKYLFDQMLVDEHGRQIFNDKGEPEIASDGIYSEEDLMLRAAFYAQLFSPNNPQEFFAQFGGDKKKMLAYVKEEIISELGGFAGDYDNGSRATLDDIGRTVMDWAEINTRNGYLKKVKEALRQKGVVFDKYGAYSDVLGTELNPEQLAMFRAFQRNLRDMQSSLTYNRSQEKVENDIPWTKVMNSRVLQERNKDTGVFETKPILKVTTPDGKITEIDIPENAQLNPFIDVYVAKNGLIVDADGNPIQDLPAELLSSLPLNDGTKFELDTTIVRDVTGKPIVISPAEMKSRALNRTKVIVDAMQTAPKDDSGVRMEDTGNGNFRGIMSPSQIAAIMGLPNSVVAPKLKRLIKLINDILARKDGTRIFMEYQASLLKGKYKALSPRFRDEVPIGFQISKDGNFLVTTISVSRMYDKAEAWASKKPENLKLWDGDLGRFWDSVMKVLQNHAEGKVGETGLDDDPERAREKKNAVNDLFNLYNADTKASNPRRTTLPRVKGKDPMDRVIAARRLDRINAFEESVMQKMPVNYGKMLENYLPDSNPMAVPQTPEEFMQNTGGSVTATEVRNAIKSGNSEQLELDLRNSDDIRPFETLIIEQNEAGEPTLRIDSILNPENGSFYEDSEVVPDIDAETEQEIAQIRAEQIQNSPDAVNSDIMQGQNNIPTQELLNLYDQQSLNEKSAKLPDAKITLGKDEKGEPLFAVATPEEKYIGTLGFRVAPEGRPDAIEVGMFRVNAAYANQGYEEAVLRELAKYAQAQGITTLYSDRVQPDKVKQFQNLFPTTTTRPYYGTPQERDIVSEVDMTTQYMPAWSPDKFAQRPEITTEPATDYEAQPLLPANKKLYRLEFGNKNTRKMTNQKGRTFFATTPEAAATLALSHAFEGIQPTPENFALYEYEIPETADIQRDYTLINNFHDAFGSARINAVRQAHNAMGIPLDVYRHVDAQNIKGITGTKIPWETNLLDYYRLIREEDPANPPMTLNEFRKNVFENPNSEEEFGYSYGGDNLEEAYDEYLADQAMANSYAVEEAKQRLKFDPNTSYLPASGEWDPNSDYFFTEEKKKDIAKTKAQMARGEPTSYREDLFENAFFTGVPQWRLTYEEFIQGWMDKHDRTLEANGVKKRKGGLTIEDLRNAAWVRNLYYGTVADAMELNFDVPQNVVDEYKNSSPNSNTSYLPEFQPKQSEEYGLEAGQQAEMRLTPKTLFNLYWMMTEPEPKNEYGQTIRKEYIDRYTNLYKNVFKDLMRKQIAKYISRGRVDPEVTTAALDAANSASDLEALMLKTYRSDMKRRNDLWNIAGEHLTNLEAAKTPKDKLFYMDRLNNAIHNTQELLFSKFYNAGALLSAFDRISSAKSTAAYRNFVDKDLREADSFDGGTAYLPAVNYSIPKDPRMLMADFYLLTTADLANIFANPLERGIISQIDLEENRGAKIKGIYSDEYLANLNESLETLSNQAQRHMQDALLFSVSAELRHAFDNKQPDRVSDVMNSEFMKKYKEIYDAYKFLGGTQIPTYMQTYVESIQPQTPAARITKGSADEYRRSYAAVRKAMEETGIPLSEVATLTEKLFREGRWNSQYGGMPWGNIAAGLRAVAIAKTRPEKIKAIDDAYALQHNTGKALNKLKRYMRAGSYSWLDQMLDYKYHAVTPREFMPLSSFAARKIAAPALQDVGFPAKDGLRQELVEKTSEGFVEELEKVVDKLASYQEDVYNNIGVTARKGTGRDINQELIKWLTRQLDKNLGTQLQSDSYKANILAAVPYVRVMLADKMAFKPELPADIKEAFEKLKKEEAEAKANEEAKAAATTIQTSWEDIAKLPPLEAKKKLPNWKQYWINWLGYHVFRKAPAKFSEQMSNKLLDIIFLINENGNIQITNQTPQGIINELEFVNNIDIANYFPNPNADIYKHMSDYIQIIKGEAEKLANKIASNPTEEVKTELKWEDFTIPSSGFINSDYKYFAKSGEKASGVTLDVWVDGIIKPAYIVVHGGGTKIILGADQQYTVPWSEVGAPSTDTLADAKKVLNDQLFGKKNDIVEFSKNYAGVNLSFVNPANKIAQTTETAAPASESWEKGGIQSWHEEMMQAWKKSKTTPNSNILFNENSADKILDAIADPVTGEITTNTDLIFAKAGVPKITPQATNTWAWIEQAKQSAEAAKIKALNAAATTAPKAQTAEEWKNAMMSEAAPFYSNKEKQAILDAIVNPNTGEVSNSITQVLAKAIVGAPPLNATVSAAWLKKAFESAQSSPKVVNMVLQSLPEKLSFLANYTLGTNTEAKGLSLLKDLTERLEAVYKLKQETKSHFLLSDINKVVDVWQSINWQTNPKKLTPKEKDEIYAYAYNYVETLEKDFPKSKPSNEKITAVVPFPKELDWLSPEEKTFITQNAEDGINVGLNAKEWLTAFIMYGKPAEQLYSQTAQNYLKQYYKSLQDKNNALAPDSALAPEIAFLSKFTETPYTSIVDLHDKLRTFFGEKLKLKTPIKSHEVEDVVAKWEMSNQPFWTKFMNSEQIEAVRKYANDYIAKLISQLRYIPEPNVASPTAESNLADLPAYSSAPSSMDTIPESTPYLDAVMKTAVQAYGGALTPKELLETLTIKRHLEGLPAKIMPQLEKFIKSYEDWMYSANTAEVEADKKQTKAIIDAAETPVPMSPESGTQWEDVKTIVGMGTSTQKPMYQAPNGPPLMVFAFTNGQKPITTPFTLYSNFGEQEKIDGTVVAGGFLNADNSITNGFMFYGRDPEDGSKLWWAYPPNIMDSDLAGEYDQITLDKNETWAGKIGALLNDPNSEVYDVISGLGEYSFSPTKEGAKAEYGPPITAQETLDSPPKSLEATDLTDVDLDYFNNAVVKYPSYWWTNEVNIEKDNWENDLVFSMFGQGAKQKPYAKDVVYIVTEGDRILVPYVSDDGNVFKIFHGRPTQGMGGSNAYTLLGAAIFDLNKKDGELSESAAKQSLMQDIADWVRNYIDYYNDRPKI